MSKERAVQMRLEGKSRSQIVDALGLKSGGAALSRWLRGVPAPKWTTRPNAKDDLRALAVELRQEGPLVRRDSGGRSCLQEHVVAMAS